MVKAFRKNQGATLKFVHITDTHLLDQPLDTLHDLNTKSTLEDALSDTRMHYPDIDFFLFTGDISQTGSDNSYTIFASVIQKYDVPVYCVPGNHDVPKSLRRIIPSCPDEAISVIRSGGFSLILLNSWVEDKHQGWITPYCLSQLDEQLQKNEERLIIALHHPPVSINSKWLDDLGLENQAEFLQIIYNYPKDVLLLYGHVHQVIDQQLGNARLLATPSTCHQYRARSEKMQRSEGSPPSYRFVELSASGNIKTKVHTIADTQTSLFESDLFHI